MDYVGCIQRDLQRDHSAGRMPDDMSALDAELAEQAHAVVALIGDGHRAESLHRLAPAVATAVEANDPKPFGREPVSDWQKVVFYRAAVNQEDRFTRATILELQVDTVDRYGPHRRRHT